MALPFGKGATDRAGVLDLENRAEEGVENHTAEGGKRRDNDGPKVGTVYAKGKRNKSDYYGRDERGKRAYDGHAATDAAFTLLHLEEIKGGF